MAGWLAVVLLLPLLVVAALALQAVWRIEDAVRLELLRMRGVDQAILDELRHDPGDGRCAPPRRGLGPEEGF